MPLLTTPKTQKPYMLIAFDSKGDERSDDPDGSGHPLSYRLLSDFGALPPTDVFVFCHGWKGDMPAAIDQYNRWIDAMTALTTDSGRMGANFRPLWLGVHWPSQPWGDEELNGPKSFAVSSSDRSNQTDLKVSYLNRLDLTDSPDAQTCLNTIFEAQRDQAAAQSLPADVVAAYNHLFELMEFSLGGAGAQPGSDSAPFDPQVAFEAMNKPGVAFGGPGLGEKLLGPLRILSFWNMKRRARLVGENGVHQLIAKIQTAAPQCSVHAMGHSFGTIVASSLCGKEGSWLPRPVDSLALLQSAVSLWSYADNIQGTGGPGYYHPMYRKPAIRGPIITTQSTFDRAVAGLYKAAVGLALTSPDFGLDINRVYWGAIGQYGIQGVPDAQSGKLLDANAEYSFENGRIYNLDSSEYICKGEGAAGAHSDIDGPEVAHALWQVALAGKSAALRNGLATTSFHADSASTSVVPPVIVTHTAYPPATTPGVMPVPFGIRAETGEYLPVINPSDLDHIGRDSNAPVLRREKSGPSFGVTASVSPDDLAQSGWGILFSNNASQDVEAVRRALKPLLELRRKQAGNLYVEFTADTGYVAGLDASDWLAERGSGLAPVNPKQGVPYYLLLVGSPQDIPFEFQYDLDTFFAVGRLYFESIDEYRRYAENMVAYETAQKVPHQKAVAVCATRHPGDGATQMLHDLVAAPMALGDVTQTVLPLGQSQGYATIPLLNVKATKANLLDLLKGAENRSYPALLFTGSHGVAFSPDDPDQSAKQGALLTQDWPGLGQPATSAAYLIRGGIGKCPVLFAGDDPLLLRLL